MPHVLKMKDGKLLTPFGIRDLLDAVQDYAGEELRREIEEYIETNVQDIDDYEKEYDRMEQENERLADHQRSVLCDIRDEVDALDTLLQIGIQLSKIHIFVDFSIELLKMGKKNPHRRFFSTVWIILPSLMLRSVPSYAPSSAASPCSLHSILRTACSSHHLLALYVPAPAPASMSQPEPPNSLLCR